MIIKQYTFSIKDGMLCYGIRRYNTASANMLRKQLQRAGINYQELVEIA